MNVMDMETWKDIWSFTFLVASVAFYAVVAIVAVKGFRDVVEMLKGMIAAKKGDG